MRQTVSIGKDQGIPAFSVVSKHVPRPNGQMATINCVHFD